MSIYENSLVFIVPNNPYDSIGGVENVVQKIAEGCSLKLNKIIISFEDNINSVTTKKINENLILFLFPKKRIFGLNFPNKKLLKEEIKKYNDCIFSIHGHHSLSSYYSLKYLSKSNKIFYNPHYHGRSGKKILNFIFPIYNFLIKSYLKKVNKLIFVSKEEQNHFLSDLRLSNNNYIIIPNGIDKKQIIKYKWKKRNNSIQNLLFVGRLVTHKNPLLLIESLIFLPNIKLTIIGDGPEKDKIMDKIKELNLIDRVIIKKNLSYTELLKEYEKTDCFILPSSYEAFGISVAEALLVGTPTIVNYSQALKEFVDNGLANPIYVLDPKKIAETIMSLKLESHREESLKYFKSWEKISNEYSRVFK